MTGPLPAPTIRRDPVRLLWRLLMLGVMMASVYALAVIYWAEYETETFCEDQVALGAASDGIASTASALGFRVRSGQTRDETTGLILVHRETLFGTSYCDIQYIDGKVVARSSGWF